MANDPKLNGMKVAVLVTDGFEQVEMTEPRRALEEAGAKVALISTHSGQVQGMKHTEKGDRFKVEETLDRADPDQFDAVMLPGGVVNADSIRMDRAAQDFVRHMNEKDKPIAVICHGPWLLVSAGLMRGRHITSWHTLQDDIRNAGGIWSDEELVRDRNWVSSRSPRDLPAFNPAMVELFAGRVAARSRA
jgi:protease I